jgi:hypothetical protein
VLTGKERLFCLNYESSSFLSHFQFFGSTVIMNKTIKIQYPDMIETLHLWTSIQHSYYNVCNVSVRIQGCHFV